MMVTRQYYFEVYERHADTVKKLGRLINGWLAVRVVPALPHSRAVCLRIADSRNAVCAD